MPNPFSYPIVPAALDDALDRSMKLIDAQQQQKAEKEYSVTAGRAAQQLYEEILAFEASLDSDQEVGAQLASFGHSVTVHLREVRFQQPGLIVLEGTAEGSGHRVRLVQHLSQLNVLLVAVPLSAPESQRPRIGFKTD